MTTVSELMNQMQLPRLSLAGAISVANELFAARLTSASELFERIAAEMKAQADASSRKWGAKEKAIGEKAGGETRAADQRVDNSVRAVHGRIRAAGMLAAERHPEAAQANALLDSLFPDGLGWINVRPDHEWAHLDKLLKRIDDEKLAATIDSVAGPAYLTELRAAFANYGQVLGKTQPRSEAESIKIAEDLQLLCRRMSAYVLQVVASADDSRPETVEAARRALQPLVDYRAASRSRAANKKNQALPAPLPVSE